MLLRTEKLLFAFSFRHITTKWMTEKFAIHFNLQWSAHNRILLFWNRKIFIEMSFPNYQRINSDWLHANRFSLQHLCVSFFLFFELVTHEIILLIPRNRNTLFFYESFVITLDRSILSTNFSQWFQKLQIFSTVLDS